VPCGHLSVFSLDIIGMGRQPTAANELRPRSHMLSTWRKFGTRSFIRHFSMFSHKKRTHVLHESRMQELELASLIPNISALPTQANRGLTSPIQIILLLIYCPDLRLFLWLNLKKILVFFYCFDIFILKINFKKLKNIYF